MNTRTATQPREAKQEHVFASSLRSPDRTAEAITGVSHLSWSRIYCYQRCPRQFHARYVEHLPPDFRSNSMLFGSGIHAGVELHHLARLEGLQISREEMLVAFRQEWSADRNRDVPIRFPNGDNEEKLHELAARAFGQFLASPLAKPAGETIAVEETVIGVIDEDLPTIVARVDLVTVADDVVRLVDLKTSKASWDPIKAAENAGQLALYKLLATTTLAEHGQQIDAEFHVLTRHATPRAEIMPVTLSDTVVETTLASARSAWDGIQAGAFDPKPNFLCRACAYRSTCPAFNG
ncbi:MAG: PD-(D/E)XK nuclease family protein [Phycisphaerae bacterium]